jgi:hypothetical protein
MYSNLRYHTLRRAICPSKKFSKAALFVFHLVPTYTFLALGADIVVVFCIVSVTSVAPFKMIVPIVSLEE